MLTVLRRAFQEAVRDRKMAWNPAEGVRGPRLRPRKVTPWTDDEVRAFMDAARRDRLHAIWRLSLLALRSEEVAGLRWNSVGLTAYALTVARVQVIVAGKVLERETAKTPAGERTLPLDEGTVKALRELYKLQRKERLAARRGVPAGQSLGSAGSPSATLATPRCPTCSTRVRCRSRWWPRGPGTLTAARPHSSTTSGSGRATSKPPGTPSPRSSARERVRSDVRNCEKSAANDRS